MSLETDLEDLGVEVEMGEESEETRKCADFLMKNINEIPISLVNKLARSKITDWCNKGAEGQLEAREYFDRHPEEAFLMNLLLKQYALIFGKSLRDAKLISESIRDVKSRLVEAKKKGLVKRFMETIFTDHEKQTFLIRRFEELNDEVEALERLKTETLFEITENQEKAELVIKKETLDRDRIASECAALRRATEVQAETLLRETREKIEEKHQIAQKELREAADREEEKRKAVVRGVDNLRESLRVLKLEINEKHSIIAELDKNPLVIEEWRRRSLGIGDVFKIVKAASSSKAEALKILTPYGLGMDYNGEVLPILELEARKLERKSRSKLIVGEDNPSIIFDLEKELESSIEFYEETKLALPPNFEDIMRDIWIRNEAEITKAIQENGFDDFLLIPGNIPLPVLKDKMFMESGYFESDNFKEGGSFSGAQSPNADKPRIILVHKAQNLKDRPELENTLNTKGQDVNQDQALSLEDYLIFQRYYFKKTGKHLDEIGWTWLSTRSGGRLVCARWFPVSRRFGVDAVDLGSQYPCLGVRPARCLV